MKITALLYLFFACRAGAGVVHHALKVSIDPEKNRLEAEDAVTMPEAGTGFIFSLHKGLSPLMLTENAELTPLPADPASADGISGKYSVRLPAKTKTFRLKYGGVINHPPAAQEEDYARGFSETPGLISSAGCYLSGATYWYPSFEAQLIAFELETEAAAGYDTVAGGDRVSRELRDGRTRAVWKTPVPQDEITLVCGKYSEYSDDGKKPALQAFLRSPDDALARKYLDAGRRYVDMYSGLIGPYPYGKFALVENFWETGYGVASFTLLGPKVIRFPFILNSSYPHEILHNWWGNGVFVDYEKGNWCEGLTAYLADYLISEGRGRDREYRVAALQKYADHVRGGKDFALREFKSRHSAASEAVGYGKALMFYHMLRRDLGDEKFKAGLRDFYNRNKFKYASFDDLKRSFEKQTGKGRLDDFFSQWVDRTGAPELALRNVRVTREEEGFGLTFTVAQLQEGPPYRLEVPVSIQLENISRPRSLLLFVTKKEEEFTYTSAIRPVRVQADPEFDLFRKLDPRETPPTLSRLLGAEKPLLLLPAAAPEEMYKAYAAFAAAWPADRGTAPEVRKDSEFTGLPKDRQIWLFGTQNAFYPEFASGLAASGARLSREKAVLDNQEFPLASATLVFAGFNPGDPAFSTGLIITDRPAKLGPLSSKLPHYGKYGYLVFNGEMTAVKTGGWGPSDKGTPVSVLLGAQAARPEYPAREPLAAPPSVFSGERMKSHVEYLASELEGRGPGEPGLKKAFGHIGAMFRQYGLKPFFGPEFVQESETDGRAVRNLAGMIPGSGRKDEIVVISAHYDHLPSAGGRVYPGANDNASGLALLFELAGHYSKQRPERTLVFAAFDGEERGRLGSRHFVENLGAAARAKVNACINLDSVGRLDGGKMLFLGAGSSDKWPHLLRGAGFVTGLDYEAPRNDLDTSDQESFTEAGIPAVQLFSGTNADYHKFTDTAGKLDYTGMIKEGEFLKEVIDYLAGDSDPLTRPGGVAGTARPVVPGRRRVSTGLVPSFEWQGKGVKADSVAPGSPLSKTGFGEGDVVIRINDAPVEGLADYSRELAKYAPGDRITITYLSDNLEKTAELELAAK